MSVALELPDVDVQGATSENEGCASWTEDLWKEDNLEKRGIRREIRFLR